MIRILQIVPCLDRGGMEQYLLNLYRRLDRERFAFDFLIHSDAVGALELEFEKTGSRITHIVSRHQDPVRNRQQLSHFFKEHPKYKIVIQHVSSLSYITPLQEAEKAGIPVRIFHCHNTREGGKPFLYPFHLFLHRRNLIKAGFVATDFYACSEPAAKWLTGGKKHLQGRLKVLPNGIDLNLFGYQENERIKCRKRLGIKDSDLLLGTVGRLEKQKNQEFLIRLLAALKKEAPKKSVKLLFVGDGSRRKVLEALVEKMQVEDDVLFVGKKEDVVPYYQAMDLFLFPSRYEGLGLALLEAQACGLPCIVSDKVPEEGCKGQNVLRIPCKRNIQRWIDGIWKLAEGNLENAENQRILGTHGRKEQAFINKEALCPYDTAQTVKQMEEIFSRLKRRFDHRYHILQVRMDTAECAGGINSYIMNLYRQSDPSRVAFDFLIPVGSRCACEEEILKLGGNIYADLVKKRDGLLAHRLSLSQFFALHPEIRTVHGHYGQLHSIEEYKATKNCRGVRRIFHAHSTDKEPRNILYRLAAIKNRHWVLKNSDLLLACSEEAGKTLLKTDGFTVVKDGIEAEKFAFDAQKRDCLRKQMELENSLVIGHVGRFVWQKNHEFLLEVFAKIHQKEKRAVLLLAGAGPLENKIEQTIEKLQLKDSVRLLGQRTDIEEIYQVMDLFLFPSRYEGFGMALLEAQAAGLPCIAAREAVPEEAKVSDSCELMPLSAGCACWSQKALEMLSRTRETEGVQKIREAGYDSQNAVRELIGVLRGQIQERNINF